MPERPGAPKVAATHRQQRRPRPERICATCGRPFTWRRKWARAWDEVRYCSRACRRGRAD